VRNLHDELRERFMRIPLLSQIIPSPLQGDKVRMRGERRSFLTA
jgi:hypothetical protein